MDACNGKRYTSVEKFLEEHGPLQRVLPQCIVVFRGNQGSGKSLTLNLLIDKLRRKATERIGRQAILGEGSLDRNKHTGTVDRWLCAAIFGFKILVYTAGDDSDAVKAAFSLVNAYACDVLVIASRATEKAYSCKALLEELNRAATPYTEIWRDKDIDADKQADDILASLEKLCAAK